MNKLDLVKWLLTTEDEKETSKCFSEGHKIVVLQRGWVAVGQLKYYGDEGVLTDSSIIRNWGTKKGLGQLALEGKTSETVLDPCGTLRFKVGTEVLILDVASSKW